jgi:hypothetical protein
MTLVRRWCISVLAVLAVFGLGLAGNPVARSAPSSHWCPGDQWDPGWGRVANWDWHQCHDWQHPGGPFGPAGWGPWGPPPPWAPPQPPPPPWAPGANLMWNPTANGWGLWNNGVWTPI